MRGEFALPEEDIPVAAVSQDGELAVTTTYDAMTRIRRTSDGSLVAEVPVPLAYDAAFDESGDRVLVVGALSGSRDLRHALR